MTSQGSPPSAGFWKSGEDFSVHWFTITTSQSHRSKFIRLTYMDAANSCIVCNAVIEYLNSSHEIVKRQSLRKCEITLWRNEHKELVLGVQGGTTKRNLQKYVIRDLKFHCNYLKVRNRIGTYITIQNTWWVFLSHQYFLTFFVVVVAVLLWNHGFLQFCIVEITVSRSYRRNPTAQWQLHITKSRDEHWRQQSRLVKMAFTL